MTPRRHRVGDGLSEPGRLLARRLDDRLINAGAPVQPTLLGDGPTPSDVELVVCDLETTGIGARADIIEIGAHRIKGHTVLASMSTFVSPRSTLPARITALTGITHAHLAGAPTLEEAIARFDAFITGASGIVAHNAPFDVGFLKRAYAECGLDWPCLHVLDTLALARLIWPRPHVANHKLATLARRVGAEVSPRHRAADDAAATIDVWWSLVTTARRVGVGTLADLAEASRPVRRARRLQAPIVAGAPSSPGVYRFLDATGDVLYVGSATTLKSRLASYVGASEQRGRIREMVLLATSVHWQRKACLLWARVDELRQLAAMRPAYNRASTHPERFVHVALTDEPLPRLVVTRRTPMTPSWGPFSSRSAAQRAARFLQRATGLRACTKVLPQQPDTSARACYLAPIGACSAPCLDGVANRGAVKAVSQVRAILDDVEAATLIEKTCEDMRDASRNHDFEQATRIRNDIAALLSGGRRRARTRPLVSAHSLVIAHPSRGGWCVSAIRKGRLGARAWIPPGGALTETVAILLDAWHRRAKEVTPHEPLWEETLALADVVYAPGTRLVEAELSDPLAWQTASLERLSSLADKVREARENRI